MRDMVFISHANPEDNEFARWLALRLAAEGYPVWCDLTRLLGGEDFWDDAERAIRERSIKFLYVLSRVSNHKEGPRNELRIANIVQWGEKLKDFVIPLRIDDLPHGEMNIEIARRNAVDFAIGWAPGLQQLLEKLHNDTVPRDSRFSVQSVAQWWSTDISADRGVAPSTDFYVSNWLPFQLRPERIFVYTVDEPPLSVYPAPLADTSYPAIVFRRSIIACAPWEEIAAAGDPQSVKVASKQPLTMAEFLQPGNTQWLGPVQLRRIVLFTLLRLAWERFASTRGLAPYELARGKKAYCFTLDLVDLKPIPFRDPFGRQRRRSLVGYDTVQRNDGTKRFWHFGVELKPLLSPLPSYAVKYHLAFSDDGRSFWDSKPRAHRARRAVGRDWWNAEWRDRTLAAVSWLAQGRSAVEIPVGPDARIEVSTIPMMFRSPVGYLEPQGRAGVLLSEDRDEDEQDEKIE